MTIRWALWRERFVGLIKYILAIYFIIAGVATAIGPGDASVTSLQPLYTNRISLIIIGATIALAGLVLLYGKIRRSRKFTGLGLFSCYLVYLFAAILNFVAYNHQIYYWLGNFVGAIIVGAMWLRWRFKTSYINPRHFRREVKKFKHKRRV